MLRLKGETRQEVAGHHNTQDILGNKEVNGNLQHINTKLNKYKVTYIFFYPRHIYYLLRPNFLFLTPQFQENLASLEVLKEDISALNLNLHTLKAQAGARQSLGPHQDRVSFFADTHAPRQDRVSFFADTQAPRQDRVSFTDEAAEDNKTEDPCHNDEIPKIQENVTG